MTRAPHLDGAVLYIAVAFVLAAAPTGCSVSNRQSTGTSVVVLVDFSKSFAPLSGDERALREVAAATAELAQKDWQPPVALLWSRIQTASLVSRPLCGPFQFQQSLIKRDGDDSAQLAQKLEECSKSTVKTSLIEEEQAPYTDITGAIALAAEQNQSVSGAKYLIIFSDFIQDLPPGKQPMKLRLNGERVLLVHRTGTQRPVLGLIDHLDSMRRWTEDLRQAGAASVVTIPISSVTRERVTRALVGETKAGTDVVVLQNLPDTARPEVLRTIAVALGRAARDWPSPVTVTWADVRGDQEPIWQMPPLEFTPKLIKTSASSATQDFPALLNECAAGMQRFSPGVMNSDIAAALRLYVSAGAMDAQHVVLIISSFPDPSGAERDLPMDLTGTRVVMLPAPNRGDAANESAYPRRVAAWEKWLIERRATVCRVPFNGLTPASLSNCMYGH